MEDDQITRLSDAEERHWWYAARRRLLFDHLRRVSRPGARLLDIGAAGGGNTRFVRAMGWQASALEYSARGAELARRRGVPVVRGDAHRLPMAEASVDVVVAFDVIEHLDDDAAAAAEIRRVLRPGGAVLVSVPADPRLWSKQDELLGHHRRYTRETLAALVRSAGLDIVTVRSWNVLLRPLAARRKQRAAPVDLTPVSWPVNACLRAVLAVERLLPIVPRLPGMSLLLVAHRPAEVSNGTPLLASERSG